MPIYAATFTRQNFNFSPPLREEVVVVLKTKIPFEDETINEFEKALWASLWKQYPVWRCPYHQGKPPPNQFENIRHGFSTPFQEGPIRTLAEMT
jgi:hypothetical protein